MSGICKANQRQNARHKGKYDAYRNSETRLVNKAKKIVKHLKRYGRDAQAIKRLDTIGVMVRRRAGVSEFYHELTHA